jgi:HPt (histidine-containing phosphotransfer) domain-containing protein
MTRPAIDQGMLEELRDSAGADFVAELAQTFAEDAPCLLATLRQSRTAGDAVAFRRAAHSLKSNATTFGALALADLARVLENGELAAVETATLAALDDACRQAVDALRELCRE